MAKKTELKTKQFAFLCAISSHPTEDSIYKVGKAIYQSPISIYNCLNIFLDRGLVERQKGKKQLIVKITSRGRTYILKNFNETRDCKRSPQNI